MTRTERQLLGIEKWKQANCKATLAYCTGVGKTRTAIAAIQRVLVKNPTVKITVVVPTLLLKDQWIDNLDKYGVYGIEVLVLNTAAKKPFYCNMLVCDELHKFAAESLSKVFENCKPKFILGLTATYERLDGREKIVLDKYAPVCDTITVEEATKNGWLSIYKEYKVMINVDLTEYNKANQIFLSTFSFFNFDFKVAMRATTDFQFRQSLAKSTGFTCKEITNKAFAWMKALQFRKSFIANHPKKIEIAKKILAARPNSKAITFNSSIKQCEAYGFGYIIHSEKKKKENAAILEEFARCGPGAVLHNSKMAKEGYDCPGLNLCIITGFSSDKTSKVQELGRIIRFEEGKESELFTLVLKGCQDNKWYQKASEGMTYIEIDESELDDFLAGKLEKQQKIELGYNGLEEFRL